MSCPSSSSRPIHGLSRPDGTTRRLPGQTAELFGAASDAAGTRLLTAGADGRLLEWTGLDGEPRARVVLERFPGHLLHLGATVLCTHAGQAMPLMPFPRVLLSGQPAVTLTSPYAVAGCALTGTPNPPCATAQWIAGAVRVMAGGAAVVTMAGQSVCVPTGTPLMPVVAQTRVLAT